jgi:hypothetical protein
LSTGRWNTLLLFLTTLAAAIVAINEMYSGSERNVFVLAGAFIAFWVSLFWLLRSEKII